MKFVQFTQKLKHKWSQKKKLHIIQLGYKAFSMLIPIFLGYKCLIKNFFLQSWSFVRFTPNKLNFKISDVFIRLL